MIRKVFASGETKEVARKMSDGKVEIYSFFPNDKADCACQALVLEWKGKLATCSEKEKENLLKDTKYLECPRSKVGMKRYSIKCKNCGEILGYCWASHASLKDFFDFHYVQWSNGKEWYGCFTPHISPITQQLCLECVCGVDTRDFRVNMTLPSGISSMIEKINCIGREFATKESKFVVRQVSNDVIPFKKEVINV